MRRTGATTSSFVDAASLFAAFVLFVGAPELTLAQATSDRVVQHRGGSAAERPAEQTAEHERGPEVT